MIFSILANNFKRSLSSSSITKTAQNIQKLLQPTKVTEGLLKESIPFSLRNGTDHFTLPLHRIIFTYCPHNGDSRALMDYLSRNIVSFAERNPTVEVVVSCKFSSRAKIEAFYNGDYQHRRLVYVCNNKIKTADDVQVQVQRLRDNSGLKAKKFKMQVISNAPAVRPIYSQFLHQNPRTRFKDINENIITNSD